MTAPEVWLRGPVEGIAPPLQPVAHALLQAREEITSIASSIDRTTLWTRPGGVAAAGFHLRHIAGVLDRLATYARGESLSETQRAYLAGEGTANEDSVDTLVQAIDRQIDRMLEQLRATDGASVFEVRTVGRAGLPSTVLGLLFHAAEHTQRHLGQLLVTVRVQQSA
jgi:uncharacterized damage-inducible protein DinB